MTREQILTILGVLVLVSPWSGMPLAWLEWVLLVLGLAIVGIAVTMPRREPFSPLPPVQVPPASASPAQDEPKPRPSHITFS